MLNNASCYRTVITAANRFVSAKQRALLAVYFELRIDNAEVYWNDYIQYFLFAYRCIF